ncbi:MAG: hypothetical protein WAV68_02505 [Candidatus Nanogingivalis sp.]
MKKKIPARNLIRFEDGLLPGDIILLWRISHGTFTNESHFHKYFSQDYGIDAPAHLAELISKGFVKTQNVFEAIEDHVPVWRLKEILTERGEVGLSKLNRNEILDLVEVVFDEKELEELIAVRGYVLTEKGEEALRQGQPAVDKHPKKKGY